MTTETELKEAIDRIARTADGESLYLYLQKVLCGFLPDGAPDSALRANEGRRRFAAELMRLMIEGLSDRAGSDISTRAVVLRADRAISPVRRSVRERLAAGDPEFSRPGGSTDSGG